jgi:hexosaminidase
MRNLFSALFLLLYCCASAQDNRIFPLERYPVIPKPQTLLALGENFRFNSDVVIFVEDRAQDKIIRKETAFFRQQVEKEYKIQIRHSRRVGFKSCIFIWLDSSGLPPEGYQMFINANDINIYGSRAGIFNALQTLFQLIQPAPNTFTDMMIPACSIIDYPRFSWRGMHLDVARHFFPKENIKEYLRYMAMYKLNTFHWHLTDDQGWRIEIKKYPLLTSIGAWRNATLIGHFSEEPDRYDSTRYGGFYTQEEIKEVVRYADSLHITVVPEIEMPGHTRAFLAAYPEFGANPETNKGVACTWGVFDEVVLPTPSSVRAMENVLDEVCALFPSNYIHIGGDECPKEEWKQSEYCQDFIRANNLKDENGLQSWFTEQIVNYLGTKGKKAIGWDEILEGGLADSAAVMSWRGEEGGIAAAKAHHNVVMTPGAYCYFDHYQSKSASEPLAIGGYLPIEKVYSYDPVPASLSIDEKKYILGVQANIWTEYIPDFRQVRYMLFPRITALAEIAWSHASIKDYPDFVRRVDTQFKYFERGFNYYSHAINAIQTSYAPSPDGNGLILTMTSLAPRGKIQYSRSGSIEDYNKNSYYTGPILISETDTITACVLDNYYKVSPVYQQVFQTHLAFGKSVTLRKQPSASYNTGGAMTLVDGNFGRRPWTGSEWLGWWGDTLDATIDLGKIDTVHSVYMVALEDPGSWIYYPTAMRCEFSLDGITWKVPGIIDFHPQEAEIGKQFKYISDTGIVARYVRVRATPWEKIEQGNPGAGYPAWLFVSEIIVE